MIPSWTSHFVHVEPPLLCYSFVKRPDPTTYRDMLSLRIPLVNPTERHGPLTSSLSCQLCSISCFFNLKSSSLLLERHRHVWSPLDRFFFIHNIMSTCYLPRPQIVFTREALGVHLSLARVGSACLLDCFSDERRQLQTNVSHAMKSTLSK